MTVIQKLTIVGIAGACLYALPYIDPADTILSLGVGSERAAMIQDYAHWFFIAITAFAVFYPLKRSQ